MNFQSLKKRFELNKYFSAGDIGRSFKLLSPYILKHRRAYMGLLFLLVTDICLMLAYAWFFGKITDAAVQGELNKLKWLIPTGFGLIIISLISTYFNIYLETISTSGVKRDFKSMLFRHVLRLPTKKISNLRTGDLISHFTNDVHSIDGVIGSSLINLIRLPFVYIAVFIFLFNINWKLCLISIVFAPIAIFISALFGILLRNNSRMIHDLIGNTNNLLSETFHGFTMIRSFTLEKLMYKKYVKQNEELFSLEIKNTKLRGWFISGSRAASAITFLISLCLGAYFVSQKMLTVGSLLSYINLVDHLVYPLTGLAGQWASFQRAATALERISKIIDSPTESSRLATYTLSSHPINSIEFQNVTFGYNEDIKVLENFNLHIPVGKVTALVGSSGAGKTTIFNLLQGLYQPQYGTITINEKSIEEHTLAEVRSLMAHVPQETFLFGGTIRENLLIARPNITEEEMIHAAILSKIHDYILTLPNGYNTEIGERGMKLSGGQKQRLAIARAILKNSPILLLDEATSALDGETEREVKESLDFLTHNRTTLVIAHRLSTIENADMIVVIEGGKIVQTGKHYELISVDGPYRKLHGAKIEQNNIENKTLRVQA
ncbi:ABC transporter permease [Bacillus sp. AFS002410]|uniref:ABC transporter ATP-binding protein n=1 Tax=Bacillus sp. AFS002410 TaxID=2033481 RepID=UPI000BF17088|nr:ABC transporter ATP-binding protein [Bacillus sp. AFS002410]PEJ58446.1 ABC transporter permease [Bacillus sp. AFS002410]